MLSKKAAKEKLGFIKLTTTNSRTKEEILTGINIKICLPNGVCVVVPSCINKNILKEFLMV